MKENNGKAANKRLWKKISAIVSITFFIIGVVSIVDSSSRTGSTDEKGGGGRGIRRRKASWRKHKSKEEGGARNGNDGSQEQRVLDASVHLVDVSLSPEALSSSNAHYEGVYGTFCPIDWSVRGDTFMFFISWSLSFLLLFLLLLVTCYLCFLLAIFYRYTNKIRPDTPCSAI